MKAFLIGLTALVATVGFAVSPASAATVTNLGQVPADGATGYLLGSGVTLGATVGTAGPVTGVNYSDGWDPWGTTGNATLPWLSVGGASASGTDSAIFNFQNPETIFTLLWGSPNTTNTIILYSGLNGAGTALATVVFDSYGAGVLGPNGTDPGDIIRISGVGSFQSAMLQNSNGGFEVADIAATPLPSTWTMLIAGFVGLGFLAYRGSKKGRAAVAAT